MGKMLIVQPRDTLFFRGGEPFNAGETSFLKSQFPPSPQVMQGFVRSLFLNLHGIDWNDYARGYCNVCGKSATQCFVIKRVGEAGSLNTSLGIRGPFIVKIKGSVVEADFFPVPLDLVSDKDGTLKPLRPGKTILSDIGLMRFPEAVGEGLKPIEGKWIDGDSLYSYLKEDKIPAPSALVGGLAEHEDQKCAIMGYYEPRLGIAIDRNHGAVVEGMLHTTSHLRLKEDGAGAYALAVRVESVPEDLVFSDGGCGYSLGGERRQVYVDITEDRPFPAEGLAESIDKNGGNFRIVFLQPAIFEKGWLPDGFVKKSTDCGVTWKGNLNGIDCELVTASVGKPVRIGGWNIKEGESRPLRSMVPAGSVYFFKTSVRGEKVVQALHDKNIGQYADLGYGHVIAGGWLDNVI